MQPLLVTAKLMAPMAGDPPHLDSLLELLVAQKKFDSGRRWRAPSRDTEAPRPGEIPIPIERTWLKTWLIASCSSPILSEAGSDNVEKMTKAIDARRLDILSDAGRQPINTTGGWTKSHNRPVRTRFIESVAWFTNGDRKEVAGILQECRFLGQKIKVGYGMIREWSIEEVETDYSWFANTDQGTLLMRPLPVGEWIPKNVIGAKPSFGAASPPYWHPDRYTEILTPC